MRWTKPLEFIHRGDRYLDNYRNHTRVKQVQRLRELLSDDIPDAGAETELVEDPLPSATYICQACGAPMIIIETFAKQRPRAPPADP